MWARWAAAVLAFAMCVSGQRKPVYRVGGDVVPPKVLNKVEPVYTPEAQDARVQGTVLLSIVVSEEGRAEEIRVIKPLGSGLDERAAAAVEQWAFQPGAKRGNPVRVFATVEVNFRLSTAPPARQPAEIAWLMELARRQDPAGMFALAREYGAGKKIARDEKRADELIRAAANLKHGPAMFELGSRQLMTRQGEETAWKLIHEAADLGSAHAQQFLGDRYSTGIGVSEDSERSRQYYRRCASSGLASCQYQLAESLFAKDGATKAEKLQAFAWALLAQTKGTEPSNEIAEAIRVLSAEDRSAVDQIQRRLESK